MVAAARSRLARSAKVAKSGRPVHETISLEPARENDRAERQCGDTAVGPSKGRRHNFPARKNAEPNSLGTRPATRGREDEGATAAEFATAKAGGERDDAPSPEHRAKGGEKGEGSSNSSGQTGRTRGRRRQGAGAEEETQPAGA